MQRAKMAKQQQHQKVSVKAQNRVRTLLAVVHLTPLGPCQGALHFDQAQALTFTGSLMLSCHDVIRWQYCSVIMHSSSY